MYFHATELLCISSICTRSSHWWFIFISYAQSWMPVVICSMIRRLAFLYCCCNPLVGWMNDHVRTAVIVKSFGPLISNDQYGSSPNINSRYGVRIKEETLDLALCNVLTVWLHKPATYCHNGAITFVMDLMADGRNECAYAQLINQSYVTTSQATL